MNVFDRWLETIWNWFSKLWLHTDNAYLKPGKGKGNFLYGDINLSQRHFVGWGTYGHIVYLCKWKWINVNVTYAQNMCGITNKLTEIVWGGGQ